MSIEDSATIGRDGDPVAQTVAVIAVHGVIPHPRYQIQDQCAKQLAGALNGDDNWKRYGHWVTSALNPRDAAIRDTLKPHPTISRVRLDGQNPVATPPPYFDVVEAYWSPIDKGKTTFATVVAWLLRTIVVPLNTTARYMSSGGKTAYDVAFVAIGIFAVIGFLLGALFAAVRGLDSLVLEVGKCMDPAQKCPTAWQVLASAAKLADLFTVQTLFALGAGVVGAVLIVQALKGIASMIGQRAALAKRSGQALDRARLVVGVLLVGVALLVGSALVPVKDGRPVGWIGLWFLLAVLMLEFGLTIAKSFIVNFFGDVQIYTTRDENSEFFALRDQILECVTATIGHACSNEANGGKGYDRVFVLAHSLGSTVALDALLRLSNVAAQDPSPMPPPTPPTRDESVAGNLRRLRGFVTFGCPLEKTKYFTDVIDPSPSAARDQWRGDLYGSLFTADASELDQPNSADAGTFWCNYWYFADVIANELDSFRSFLPPGTNIAAGHHLRRLAKVAHQSRGEVAIGRLVCRNERGAKGLQLDGILPHGDYLSDNWFWHTDANTQPPHLGVLDIVARCSYPSAFTARATLFAQPVRIAPGGFTSEAVSVAQASKYLDRVPPPAGDGA